jgi:hypothetical protein
VFRAVQVNRKLCKVVFPPLNPTLRGFIGGQDQFAFGR